MGVINNIRQSMRLLTAGSLVRAQLEEPNKDNSFDTKTVVLFLCLKRLNRAVCRSFVCQWCAKIRVRSCRCSSFFAKRHARLACSLVNALTTAHSRCHLFASGLWHIYVQVFYIVYKSVQC